MTTIMHYGRRSLKWLPFLLFPFLLLASCSESDGTVEEYPDWQNKNTAYWASTVSKAQNAIAQGDTSWKIFRNYSIEDTLSSAPVTDNIVVNVLENGTGSGSPLYTDSVRVRYEGRLLPSTSYADGYVFDTTWPEGTTDATAGVADFKVSKLTDGFATALQHMHIGDKWLVYVPWTLAYGESGSGSIPGYSVLRFTIQLVAYSREGSSLPKFKAKRAVWVTE